MRKVRGNEIAMIFQDPMTSLNPVHTIGRQIIEAVQLHRRSRKQRCESPRDRAAERSASPPGRRARRLPAPVLGRHAPARDDRHGAHLRPRHADRRRADDRPRRDDPGPDPRADARAPARLGSAIIMITHDLGVVAEIADRDRDVRRQHRRAGQRRRDLPQPAHPYTWGLLSSIPRLRAGRRSCIRSRARRRALDAPPGCRFHRAARTLDRLPPRSRRSSRARPTPTTSTPATSTSRRRAARRESWASWPRCPQVGGHLMARGAPRGRGPQEVFPIRTGSSSRGDRARPGGRRHVLRGRARARRSGLVGESGCGKSTTARCILRLLDPTGGKVVFDGQDITHADAAATDDGASARADDIFQDPYAWLNPRMPSARSSASRSRSTRSARPPRARRACRSCSRSSA